MNRVRTPLGAGLVLLLLTGAPLWAANRELKTVNAAAEAVHDLAGLPLKGIPPALLRDARGVAVIPNVFKAGLVIDGRFGRGVIVARQPDGSWSNPVFLTLTGSGVGLQAGVQSTDVILIFKTNPSMDRFLRGKGKLVLGADASVAAGPVGREAQAATDARLKAEVYSYSRSRGLFAGVSLEGARLQVDHKANKEFYRVREGRPAEVLSLHGVVAVEKLRKELSRLSGPPTPPTVIVVPAPPPPPPPPPLRHR